MSEHASTPPTLSTDAVTPTAGPDDTSPPPTLKRSSTPVAEEIAAMPDAATPPTIKRAKTVSFESKQKAEANEQSDVEKTTGTVTEHSELIQSLVDLLHNGKVTAAALLAMFSELKALPHKKTSEPVDEEERAFEHRIMLDKVREATISAWKKAHIQMNEVAVVEVD